MQRKLRSPRLNRLDPQGLLDEIRAVQHQLAAQTAGATVHPIPQRDADLDQFPAQAGTGMVRRRSATDTPDRHQAAAQLAHPARPVRDDLPLVVKWLDSEPQRTAKELFDRLPRKHPRMFPPGQLRTLQRRVRDWCRLEARRLILADPIRPSQGAAVSGAIVADTYERDHDPSEVATRISGSHGDAAVTPVGTRSRPP